MKVRPSVKTICEKCKIIKRKGRVMVICDNPKTNSAKVNNKGAHNDNFGGAKLWLV